MSDDDDFKAFLKRHWTTLRNNLNLTDSVLVELETRSILANDEYEKLCHPKKAPTERAVDFYNILKDNPRRMIGHIPAMLQVFDEIHNPAVFEVLNEWPNWKKSTQERQLSQTVSKPSHASFVETSGKNSQEFQENWKSLSKDINLGDLVLEDLADIGILAPEDYRIMVAQQSSARIITFRSILFKNLTRILSLIPAMIQVFEKHNNASVVLALHKWYNRLGNDEGQSNHTYAPQSDSRDSGSIETVTTTEISSRPREIAANSPANYNFYGDFTFTNINNFIQNRNNYFATRIRDETVDWRLNGKKITTLQLENLLSESQGSQSGDTKKDAKKKGYALYLNWRFDNENNMDKFYKKHILKSAKVDEPRVFNTFSALVNNEVCLKVNIGNLKELQDAVYDFKRNWVKRDADYIVVILNSHGYNRTQLLTDDLKPFDLYRHIAWELDYNKFKKVGKKKPRIYLVNACQYDSKVLAADTVEINEPVNQICCQSPYFILFAAVPNEGCWSHETEGSVFFRAIIDELQGGQNLVTAIYQIQQKIDYYAGKIWRKQTMSLSQSATFEQSRFMFTPTHQPVPPHRQNRSFWNTFTKLLTFGSDRR